MLPEVTTTGLQVMGDLPWGSHFCYFYESKQDLIDASVLFFQAGLENHEFCLWCVHAPVTEADALQALRESIPALDRHLAEGAMEIVVHRPPLFDGDFPEPRASVRYLDEKLEAALARGYAGMRVAGSPTCLQKASIEHFRQFEWELGRSAANHRMIALCQFPVAESSAAEILDAARTHQFVIVRRQGEWEIIQTPEFRGASAEITKLNEQLEQRVEERTRALEAVNEKLRKEIARREQVEEDLRRQNEILQSIFDHVPLAMKYSDKEGRIQIVNGEWGRVIGRTHNGAGKPRGDVLVERYPDPVERRRVLDFAANSNGEWADFKAMGRDGRVEDTSWAVVRLSDGATICIGQDVSERKRAERELRKQKEILQTIFDHIPVMITFRDRDFGLQLANREWEHTFGWSMEEVIRNKVDMLREIYPDPKYREQVRDFVHNTNGEWRDFKTTVRDGRVVDVSWVMLHLLDGTILGIGQNISDRKRAERELRKQKEILQTIFDHIPLMINFGDRDSRLQLVNREWERTFGWSAEEIRRDKVDILAECYPDPEYREQALEFTCNSNREWRDFKTKVRDGRILDTSWVMLHLADGTIIGIGQDITRRKRAEEALRESEERFRQLAENIDDLFWIVSPDFKRSLYLSPAYERITGRSRQERYRGEDYQSFLDIIHPEDRERIQEIIRRGAESGFDVEFRIVRPDGSLRWIRDRGFPIRDQSGQVYRIAGIANDITERKLAEEALRESEERFRQLAENITDLFWMKTPDSSRVLYLSPAYENFTGRSRQQRYQDVDAQPFLDSIHAEDRERMAQIIRSAAGAEFDVEFRILRGDGSLRWIRSRGFPIRDQSGQIYRIAGIATDITARKLAEEALRESEERFRQLTENINEMFWLSTPDFSQDLYVSPAFQNLTGMPPETISPGNKSYFDFVHPDDLPMLVELTKKPGEKFDIEYRLCHADGSIRWVRDRGFPIRDKSGVLCSIGGVAEDITDRKQAEERLKASSEQLRALSASLQSTREKEAKRIAQQIHDELGGILTGLRWELEALEKMIQQPADPGRLKAMQDKLGAMVGLTDTTINVVRRIASELRPSILDDLGLVEAVEWQTQQFQARTGIECRYDCSLQRIPLDNPQCTAVFRIVQEALTNILRHAQATEVAVAMKEVDGIFELRVSDNGRGITPAEMSNNKSLGLLGMRENAHLIGGRVDIVGLRGSGTTVHVRVPLRGGAR